MSAINAYYLDTSALVKLLVDEEKSAAMKDWRNKNSQPVVTCDLTRTELFRVVHRLAPDRLPQARLLLDSLILVATTPSIYEGAGRLAPLELRTLDAIHLEVALSLVSDLAGMITYDHRLASAAEMHGIPVLSPS